MKKLIDKYIHRSIKQENRAFHFGSFRFRVFVLAGLSFFIIIVCLLGWLTLEQNKKRVIAGIGGTLKVVLKSANGHLNLWMEQRKNLVDIIGHDPELVEITKRLLAVPPNREDILTSEALQDARAFYKNKDKVFSNIGFFIINPDHISIGSMRDGNISTLNLISSQRPELLRQAFNGDVLYVPPIQSDFQLGQSSKQDENKKPSTNFVTSQRIQKKS